MTAATDCAEVAESAVALVYRAGRRLEVHLTKSEFSAPKTMVGHEGYVPTEWVVARIRIKMSCADLSHGGSPTESRAIYSVVGSTLRGSNIEAAE